jgi:chemotaxis protein CheZ
VQRKVFRVEQLVGSDRDANREQPDYAGDHPAESEPHPRADHELTIERELAAIRDAIAHDKRELSALINDGKERRMARAAGEPGAAVGGMETATQNILASVEVIDDCVRTLGAALADDYHHGLTQDVQDHVVRIYEACNFQDLAGQRISKVIATLIMVEERLVAMLADCNNAGAAGRPTTTVEPSSRGEFANGPKLDGDSGHASQCDIDAMFA